MTRVLVIDDNEGVREALRLLLELSDYEVGTAATPRAGLAELATNPTDLVIQDMNFEEEKTSGSEGAQLFEEIRVQYPDMPVILLTAWTNLEMAVSLVKQGAADYLGKPWDDNRLMTTVRNLVDLSAARSRSRELALERARTRAALEADFDLRGIVYVSEAMHEVVSLACRVAASDISVLVTGPNGAGKEKLAEILQANSSVSSGPFVRVNAGGLPGALLEAELFGAEPGAYTGLTKTRIGRFEAADGGTLFLDEIGNLSAEGQNRLLRVLQSGEFERLGSSETRRVKVRVISATNADLKTAIARGDFREDLYYRLNVIELKIPPLVDRPGDAAALASYFLDEGKRFSAAALRVLEMQSWEGNVRELQNLVKRAEVLSSADVIDTDALGLQSSGLSKSLLEPSEADVRVALRNHGNVVARAARELGMSRQALYRRMVKFGLHESTNRDAE
ncbi:MAG: sigma-54 dependent transcriptional regulator [Pseudomonadota bacterium]